MEWIGWLSFAMILCYAAYPSKTRKLESKVKKLQREQRGVSEMSKIISALVGQDCKLKTEDNAFLFGSEEMVCTVLDADDEWIKLTYCDKKNVRKTKILRVDAIESVELAGE